MSTVLDYASAATIVTPPDQWILAGQSSNSPYLAAYHVWVAVETLGLISPMYDMYDSTGPGWFVNKITPYGYPTKLGTAVNDGIFLAAGAADTYGVQIQAYEDRDVRLQVVDSSSATKHFWRWKRDGVLAISGTTQVQGLLAGKEASTELRYGYGPASAYPTFRYEYSPRLGGWTPNNPEESFVKYASPDTGALCGVVTAGTLDAKAMCPVRIPYDTTRATSKTAFTFKGLYVEGYTNLATSASIRLAARELATGTVTTVLHCNLSAAGPVDTSDTTPLVACNPGLYDYFLEWTAVGANYLLGSTIKRLYLEIEKRTVE